MIGARLGPYEITAKLGEGGMGEVYRATDTRLKREVAIKVLPAAFTEDRERLARFEREAQLLAQLHHPNIASIFGLEESDGTRALVMELVEGPTLAERLASGALPLPECLSIARQIAEALEEAHEKGIVHRDLKPANVKVTDEGKVKVLDFGLAKALDASVGPSSSAGLAASPSLMNSPTLTAAHGTQLGMILGTAAYMAPEQAKGKAVDRRGDIWAFGVVLFEMLTGRRLFEGETASEVLAAVIREEIDWTSLPQETPPGLRRLLARCLERDPRLRLRDIGEARIALGEDRVGRSEENAPPGRPAPRRSPARLAAILLAGLGALAGAVYFGRGTAPRAAAGNPAAGAGFDRFTRLTSQAGLESSPSISPDGEFVAYVAIDGGDRDIFLLRVGGQKAINLTEDSPADEERPAFSPDGRFLAFRSERGGGGLFVMGATGESVRRLTDFGDNPSWSPDGSEIVFGTEGESDPQAREKTSELWVVPAAGGEARRIYAGDAVQPAWSPHGHRIAFWTQRKGVRDVWTLRADGSDPQRVTDAPSVDWNPVWSPDGSHLYFASDRGGVMTAWRVAIDELSGRLRGEPAPVTLPAAWSGQLSLAADERRFAYRTSEMTAEVRRIPFDREAGRTLGPAERLFDTVIPAAGLDLSADGWLTFRTAATQEDVYVMRADGSGLRKLTDDPAKDRAPVWSPDGSQVAFYSNRGGRYEIWTVGRDGGNLRQRTDSSAQGEVESVYYPVWAPDGRSLVFSGFDSGSDQVFRLPLRDSPVPIGEVERIPVDPGDAALVIPLSWSPDGRKLAGIRVGQNGQLLAGIFVHDLVDGRGRFLPIDRGVPPPHHIYPVLSWLPDSRRGIVRWGEVLLRLDTDTGEATTLIDGFHRDGGVAQVSHDGRWIYMLDTRDEGDIWLASRESPPAGSGTAPGAPPGAPR
ncbi:MAG TPA: protein kinase [Thermoanaerobaculia bacterium]|nr:protein kinase [Thermoanaerobaculia bacterium]